MKIFVIGHNGFVGGHLLNRLNLLGHEVITDMRYFDDKFDCVVHLASVTHIRNEFDPKLIESNFILPDRVFRRSGRIIFTSSCSAEYPTTSPYALSKVWGEYLAQKHGNAVSLRFFNIYGIGASRGIVWYLMNQPDGAKITVRGKDLIRDYVAVENCVDEIIAHLNMGNTVGVQDVGTGIGTTTIDLVWLFAKLSGKVFKIETIPAGDNEPYSMISNRKILNAISLENGLRLLIEDKNKQP